MDRDEYKIETLPEDWWDRFVKKIKGGNKTQKLKEVEKLIMAETTHNDHRVHFIDVNDLPRGEIRNKLIKLYKKAEKELFKLRGEK